jgi:chromosome segregation ATPase
MAAGSATEAQIDANKRREADIAKMRRQLDESNMNHENVISAVRKKHNDAVAEMGDQLEQLNKAKAKIEKDRALLQRQFEDAQTVGDGEAKAKMNYERMCRQLEMQVADLQAKGDDLMRQLADAAHQRNRLQNELIEYTRHLEGGEGQIHALQRLKSQLGTSLEEAKRAADTESRERQSLLAQCRGFQHELDQLREQLDREETTKSDLMRQLSKSNAEVGEWRARFESEGLIKVNEECAQTLGLQFIVHL